MTIACTSGAPPRSNNRRCTPSFSFMKCSPVLKRPRNILPQDAATDRANLRRTKTFFPPSRGSGCPGSLEQRHCPTGTVAPSAENYIAVWKCHTYSCFCLRRGLTGQGLGLAARVLGRASAQVKPPRRARHYRNGGPGTSPRTSTESTNPATWTALCPEPPEVRPEPPHPSVNAPPCFE